MIFTSCYPQPIQRPEPSLTYCDCAALQETTFFLLDLSRVDTSLDTGQEIERYLTAMAFTVDAIEKIVEQHRTSNGMELRSVHVVTSVDTTQENIWKVDRLAAIWTIEDAPDAGNSLEIYEALSGYTHGLSRVGSQSDAFARRRLRMRFPLDKLRK